MGNSSSDELENPSTELEILADKSEHNPGQFEEGQFVNNRGLTLHTYYARAVGLERGVVIVHHGIRAHGLYEVLRPAEPGGRQTCFPGSVADLLVQNGFHVYVYDCEGHGLSDSTSEHGYFDDGQNLVADFVQLANIVRGRHTLPLFGFGTSLGGGIVVGVGTVDPPVLDGMVVVAPMISVEQIKNKGANKYLLPLAGFAAQVLPRARLAAMAKNPDPDSRATWENDPLTESSDFMMVGPSVASMNFAEDLAGRLEEVRVPFLTIHSPDDTFTDYKSSVSLKNEANVTDKTFLEPPAGSCHNLLSDSVSREWTRSQVVEWLKKHGR